MAPLNVAFLHPDLGIGGAERLVVDAAVALQGKGHKVTIFTAHHDPDHAFPETVDGTLRVIVFGDGLPRHVFGKGHVLFAGMRSVYTAMRLVASNEKFDAVFVDQISTSLPLLKVVSLFLHRRIVFYCHFPDKLLASHSSWLRRIYRMPFDLLEEMTTAFADVVVVNSRFTRSVFARAFPILRQIKQAPAVLYPAVSAPVLKDRGEAGVFALSLNRYERKKDVGLAIRSLALLEDKSVRLVVAGGYDVRVAENVGYLAELEELSESQGVSGRVDFERSITNERRDYLLSHALCLMYTPPDEHFGIVPLEAMARGCPVLAVNSGGPLETVLHRQTGFLLEPTPEAFASAMRELVDDAALRAKMRTNASKHVRDHFSLANFADQLEGLLRP
ncbi:hypothetical protein M885DRAFT_544011 [Pelagophyceae sp. CCMP2097]|nr:hypothetical protein M885DRAFT_544011 [Pelagophyceae sp. CCMP2097]